jgi:hypothetical protein
MTTRPLPPPPVYPDDPGPWAGILEVLQRRGAGPGRRRAEPPNGLMLMPPPKTAADLVGLDAGLGIAGAGPVRTVAAAREPALGLRLLEDGRIEAVATGVRRLWEVPGLTLAGVERPEINPAPAASVPVLLDDLAAVGIPEAALLAPGGTVAAVYVAESARVFSLAIVRTSDLGVCRLIRWVRAAAWSADGQTLVIGGDWGMLALEHRDQAPSTS